MNSSEQFISMCELIFPLIIFFGSSVNGAFVLIDNLHSYTTARLLCSEDYDGYLASQNDINRNMTFPKKSFMAWIDGRHFDDGIRCPEGINRAYIVEDTEEDTEENLQVLCGKPNVATLLNGSTCLEREQQTSIETLSDLYDVQRIMELDKPYAIGHVNVNNFKVSCKTVEKTASGKISISYNPCNMVMNALCVTEVPKRLSTLKVIQQNYDCGDRTEVYNLSTLSYLSQPEYGTGTKHEITPVYLVLSVPSFLILIIGIVFCIRYRHLNRRELPQVAG